MAPRLPPRPPVGLLVPRRLLEAPTRVSPPEVALIPIWGYCCLWSLALYGLPWMLLAELEAGDGYSDTLVSRRELYLCDRSD